METGVCFNAIPSGVSFLNGCLMDREDVKAAQRRTKQAVRSMEDVEEETAETMNTKTDQDQDPNKLSATEGTLRFCRKTLKEEAKKQYKQNKKMVKANNDGNIPTNFDATLKERSVELCAIQYTFNPDSFCQTVENINHLSFLMRQTKAGISNRPDPFEEHGLRIPPGPKVRFVEDEKDETEEEHLQRKDEGSSIVVAFNMRDWKRLKEVYNVKKGLLPNRPKGKKQANGQQQQDEEEQSNTQERTSRKRQRC